MAGPLHYDLLSNGGFKEFFGDPNNKKEVMMILNTFLPESRKVADIETIADVTGLLQWYGRQTRKLLS